MTLRNFFVVTKKFLKPKFNCNTVDAIKKDLDELMVVINRDPFLFQCSFNEPVESRLKDFYSMMVLK